MTTISDASFAAFLRDDGQRKVLLAEMDYVYESGGAPATGTRYFSDTRYRTTGSDSPPHRVYADRIVKFPSLLTAISAERLAGGADMRLGSLALGNADGGLDYLLTLIVDGQEVRTYVGGEDWPRADFRLVRTATVQRIESAEDDTILNVMLLDQRFLLDASILGDVVATGQDAGKSQAVIYGVVLNHEPLVKDSSTTFEYHVVSNYMAGTVVHGVRDNGIELQSDCGLTTSVTNATLTANAGTDTMTFTSHGLQVDDVLTPRLLDIGGGTQLIFAGLNLDQQYWVISGGLTANDFRLSTTKGGAAVNITGTFFDSIVSFRRRRFFDSSAVDGTIRLSASPSGRVTCDVENFPALTTAPFQLLRQMALDWGGLAADYIPAAPWESADDALYERIRQIPPASGDTSVALGLCITSRTNLVELLDAAISGVLGWFAPRRDGTLGCGLMDLSALQSEELSHTLTSHDVHPGSLTYGNMPIRFGEVAYFASRNQVIQADGLASGVSAANRAKWTRAFQTQVNSDGSVAGGYAANWWRFHTAAIKTAFESFATLAFPEYYAFDTISPRTDQVPDQMVLDEKPHHKILTATTFLDAYDWEIGDVVRVTYPRYGLDDGWNFRVVGLEPDLGSLSVRITLMTQATPDYSTVYD